MSGVVALAGVFFAVVGIRIVWDLLVRFATDA